jgi:hypothetical protein
MQIAWLARLRAWGDRHPRIGAFLETFAHINAIVIGLWASMALAVDALLVGLHTSRQTASHEGIIISSTGKVAWVITGVIMAIGALLYARYLQTTLPRLPRPVLLPLCVLTIGFGLLIDTLCGHMSALVTVEADNDWVNGALKLWTWTTWSICAPPLVEWMQRPAGDK